MTGDEKIHRFCKKEEINPFGKHRGAVARHWRRGVGALTDGKNESVRTFKFPLDGINAVFDFDEAAKLYGVVEGVGEGSLAGYLCAVHLSGFRIYHRAFGGNDEMQKNRAEMTFGDSTIAFNGEPFYKMTGDDGVAVHWTVALVARQLKKENEKPASKTDLTRRIFSSSPNAPHGLSWLFGGGITHFFADKEKSDAQLADGFGIPKGDAKRLARIQQVRRYANALLPVPFYRADHYSDFRVAVAGTLGGWIANYWKRLGELEKLLGGDRFGRLLNNVLSLKEKIKSLNGDSGNPSDGDMFANTVFSRLPFRFADIELLADELPRDYESRRHDLAVLRGESDDELPTAKTVNGFDEFNEKYEEFRGCLMQLKNIAVQNAGDDESGKKRGQKKSAPLFAELNNEEKYRVIAESVDEIVGGKNRKKQSEDESDTGRLPKINRISGGVADVDKIAADTESHFNALVDYRRRCFDGAMKATESGDLLTVLRAELKKKYPQKPEDADEESAARLFLQKLGGVFRKLSRGNKKEIADKILMPFFTGKPRGEESKKERKDYRQFIDERKGAIYGNYIVIAPK